jgi:hypothetical protein
VRPSGQVSGEWVMRFGADALYCAGLPNEKISYRIIKLSYLPFPKYLSSSWGTIHYDILPSTKQSENCHLKKDLII